MLPPQQIVAPTGGRSSSTTQGPSSAAMTASPSSRAPAPTTSPTATWAGPTSRLASVCGGAACWAGSAVPTPTAPRSLS
eukprot:5951504-Alexandrium_andersonii.AAC.1